LVVSGALLPVSWDVDSLDDLPVFFQATTGAVYENNCCVIPRRHCLATIGYSNHSASFHHGPLPLSFGVCVCVCMTERDVYERERERPHLGVNIPLILILSALTSCAQTSLMRSENHTNLLE